jgi:hypothetical protein
MTQAQLELKYSIQQWRERTISLFNSNKEVKSILLILVGELHSLIKREQKSYGKGVQWETINHDMDYDFISEVFTAIVEGILRHARYTMYVPYSVFIPGLATICKKYAVGEDPYKAAFDLIWVMNRTWLNEDGSYDTWYSHGYTPGEGQGAVIIEQGTLNYLKQLGLYQDLSLTLKSLPPMVEKPRKWRSNYDGGYLFHSATLTKNNTANEILAEYADIIQSQAFRINEDILMKFNLVEFLQTKLEGTKSYGLRHRIEDMLVELAGRDLYMVPFFDARGRQYFYGWEVNFQSTKLNKAMWELPESLPM